MAYTPTELEALVRQRATGIAKGIQDAAQRSANEAVAVELLWLTEGGTRRYRRVWRS